MMVKLGNFFFRYRNGLFPLVYLVLLIKSPFLVQDHWLAAMVGFLVAFAGQLIRAVTIGLEYIVRGGRNRQVYAEGLVQGGIFAHCRNPLYLGNFLILLGVGIASDSILFLGVAIPFFAFVYAAIIAAEENYLQNKFGQQFVDYCARVNRLLPNIHGLSRTLTQARFNWARLITAEYGSAFAWLAAITLVCLKNMWLTGDLKTQRPTVWVLCGWMVALITAYGIARFLKKSRILNPA